SCNPLSTSEPYPLSLHDALPIFRGGSPAVVRRRVGELVAELGAELAQVRREHHRSLRATAEQDEGVGVEHGRDRTTGEDGLQELDRKSTRLNSSHVKISYAVFCL